MRQYGRKKPKGHAAHDPNDRSYDRRLEQNIQRMRPDELDALLHLDDREDG